MKNIIALTTLTVGLFSLNIMAETSTPQHLYYEQAEWGTKKFLIHRLATGDLELEFSDAGVYSFNEDWAPVAGWEKLEAEFEGSVDGLKISPVFSDQVGRTWNGMPTREGVNVWKAQDIALAQDYYGLKWEDTTSQKLLTVGWKIEVKQAGRVRLKNCRLFCQAEGQTQIRTLFADTKTAKNLFWPKQEPVKVKALDNKAPRIFGADNSVIASNPEWRKSWISWAQKEFPGQFGLDFNTLLYPDLKESIQDYRENGIMPVYECHSIAHYYERQMLNAGHFLQRWDGFSPSQSIWPEDALGPKAFLLYHAEDTSTDAVLQATVERMNAAFDLGFETYFMIDYCWPYTGGRWGYGAASIKQWQKFIRGQESGVSLVDPEITMTFSDYWKRFTSLPLEPESFGWKTWDDFFCGTEAAAQRSHLGAKRLLLFNALWHYQCLAFLNQVGKEAHMRSRSLGITVNPEDVANGTDVSLLSRLKYLGVLGYEYFGYPGQGQARQHTLAHLRFRKGGPRIDLIGEINGGGQGGTSRYDREVAFAYYYDATASCLPSSINNQYFKTVVPWPKGITDTGLLGRFDHWFSGNHAFLLRHDEEKKQPVTRPNVTVVASRSILEYQDSSVETMSQDANLASYLDQLNVKFEQVGRDVWNPNLDTHTKTLFWCPSVSQPRELASIKEWIGQGKQRTLVIHGGSGWRIDQAAEQPLLDAVMWSADRSYRDSVQRDTTAASDNMVPFGECKNSVNLCYQSKILSTSWWDANVKGKQVLLADANHLPLVSTWNVADNRIILIHADFPARKNDLLAAEVLAKILSEVGISTFAQENQEWSLHYNQVPGGSNIVAWHQESLREQRVKNLYQRSSLSESGKIELNVEPDTEYIVASLFEQNQIKQKSDARGRLKLELKNSSEIIYYGKSDNAVFLESVKRAAQSYTYCLKRTRLEDESPIAPATLQATY